MLWRALALFACALFLALVARFYHPGLGFSALLVMSEAPAESRLPVISTIPHYTYPSGAEYDGAQYVQLAMVPLLRDPAIDRALDAPPYRARRILFCWTAYAIGLGRPAWIMQVYALQNVVCWLVLAWFVTRWFPLTTARFFLLWFASMFSHGLLASVRLAVLDGPSLMLLAFALAAAERGRTWTSAAVLGVAGLARETNILGGVALPWPARRSGWIRAALAGAIVVVPLLVWQDYVWSIYRGTSTLEGTGHITVPFTAYFTEWDKVLRNTDALRPSLVTRQVLGIVALTVQAAYLLWAREWKDPWWRLAAVYAVLLFVVQSVVWDGYPGAITRVVLPLKLAFNVLLARDRSSGFWAWFLPGNLDLAMSVDALAT